MTKARVQPVQEDRVRAREFISQAELFMTDAAATSLRAPSRAVLLHNAAISACDAVLQASGSRITSGDGAHMLRLQEALARIEGDTEELLERLDASRSRRNEASYELGWVAQASIDDARDATSELVELARAFVG